MQVGYNTNGWLDKNKDPINDCVVQLMQESKEPLVATFFKEPDDGPCLHQRTQRTQRTQRNALAYFLTHVTQGTQASTQRTQWTQATQQPQRKDRSDVWN